MTTKEEMPPSQADVGCAIEMLAHISEPIAAALSDLLAHVRAEARAEGVAAGKAICQTQQHADRIRLGTADNERLLAERVEALKRAESAHAAGVAEGEKRERQRCRMIAFSYPGCGSSGGGRRSSDCAWHIGNKINSSAASPSAPVAVEAPAALEKKP